MFHTFSWDCPFKNIIFIKILFVQYRYLIWRISPRYRSVQHTAIQPIRFPRWLSYRQHTFPRDCSEDIIQYRSHIRKSYGSLIQDLRGLIGLSPKNFSVFDVRNCFYVRLMCWVFLFSRKNGSSSKFTQALHENITKLLQIRIRVIKSKNLQ
jgi:hypothetical protein